MVPTRPDRSDVAAASFSGRLPRIRSGIAISVPLILLASVVLVRGNGLPTGAPSAATAGAVKTASPAELKAAAADVIERVTAPGGTGLSFEIVQRSTIKSRVDGPKVELPDPSDPKRTVLTNEVAAGTYLQHGSVTPAGFYSEIRRGPDDPTAKLDWDSVGMELAALVRDGKTYRNDGSGWYETDRPPGIGLDPVTAALLPTMLRDLADAADKPSSSEPPGGASDAARKLEGSTEVGDVPGIIGVDLADSTELPDKIELAFDESGRLIGIRVVARNTNLDQFDLMVDTTISFSYPDSAPQLPKPEPRYVEPSMEPEPEP